MIMGGIPRMETIGAGMKKVFIIPILFILFFQARGYCQNIKIVTEEYPPYNYTENGKISGLSTDIVKAVLREIGIDAGINTYPWKRAYEMALNEPDVLIYSIGRNSQRENLFKWVGVIAPYKVYFFALKERSDIKIDHLDDAKKYKIGTTIDDAREQYLLSKGFDKGVQIEEVGTNDLNVKKLFWKRIDLVPMPELVGYDLTKRSGFDPSQLRKVFEIKDISSEGLYMAFSKGTSDELVDKFRQALDKIKGNGTFGRITSSYTNGDK